MSKAIEVTLKDGLDARNVARLVQKASDFKSEVFVGYQNKKVNAKSIMGMMSLGAAAGEVINVTINGEDEETASAEIEAFLTA